MVALALVLIVGGLTRAQSYAAQTNETVSGTNNESVYKAGQTVTITGTVNGDIFCIAQTVTIQATVNGDIICAGQSVTVNGIVHGNVRLAGQSVSISAHVDKAATVTAQTVSTTSTSSIGSDYTIAATTATLDGGVARDIHAVANNLTLASNVGRNVTATVHTLLLKSQSSINGSLTYTSPHKLQQNSGAVVRGPITYHQAAGATPTPSSTAFSWGGVAFRAGVGLSLLISSLILVALFPRMFRRANAIARQHSWPWPELVTGIVAMIAVPIILIVLALLAVTMPLAVLGFFLWSAALLLAAPLAAYYIGRLLFRSGQRSPVLVMLVGGVVLWVLILVPWLNWIVTALAAWFGTGLLLRSLRRLYTRPDYEGS